MVFSKKRKKNKARAKPTSFLGKAWYFIWHDNSLLSWLANIVLAFVLIKFVLFPVLGALMGTSLPIVAVVSESMDHRFTADYSRDSQGRCVYRGHRLCDQLSPTPVSVEGFGGFWGVCGGWYEQRGMSKEEFSSYPLSRGFSKGDIIVLVGRQPQDVSVGDIIVFQSGKAYPIIHRVVNKTLEGSSFVYMTKGDHNAAQIKDGLLDETRVPQDRIIGVAVAKVPWLGWVKIGLVELLQGRTC